jgi:hypothetical protein
LEQALPTLAAVVTNWWAISHASVVQQAGGVAPLLVVL